MRFPSGNLPHHAFNILDRRILTANRTGYVGVPLNAIVIHLGPKVLAKADLVHRIMSRVSVPAGETEKRLVVFFHAYYAFHSLIRIDFRHMALLFNGLPVSIRYLNRYTTVTGSPTQLFLLQVGQLWL